ncbi:hypothetical protein CLOP_g5590, partial [Closterium sp. NIES-67]
MAWGNRLLSLAALAVGLLAVAACGARDMIKGATDVAAKEPPEGGKGVAGQQRKGARILAAETFSQRSPLPDYLSHIPRRKALAT